jgi:hypothetical protein
MHNKKKYYLLFLAHLVQRARWAITITCRRRLKSINILKIWWKKDNNSKIGNGIYLKIAGYVDLDMLQFFAI